ncbi:hypothetical protein BO78DRAFT_132353 [Aspergillus sclerotiicarbonarius CBS 121057]|uniref:Uncharacterized protein n=1 Tax=Aspergillus sclerotiicarbonarius (strain CBS 121057 / IBT 28362) TaxID=1448318 RepID=A0A319EM69_ASPSB|nr:hypothetical protein BO78DRAFT_132353 [Aspergillus sclerotiicarbonarius CBS 121057]
MSDRATVEIYQSWIRYEASRREREGPSDFLELDHREWDGSSRVDRSGQESGTCRQSTTTDIQDQGWTNRVVKINCQPVEGTTCTKVARIGWTDSVLCSGGPRREVKLHGGPLVRRRGRATHCYRGRFISGGVILPQTASFFSNTRSGVAIAQRGFALCTLHAYSRPLLILPLAFLLFVVFFHFPLLLSSSFRFRYPPRT